MQVRDRQQEDNTSQGAAGTTKAVDAPREEYTKRLDARQEGVEQYARQEHHLSNARLAVFALGLLTAWLAFHDRLFSGWFLLLPIVAFVVLAHRHDRAIRQRRRAERAVAFYESGLRRLDNQWQGAGNSGSRFLRAEHPYAIDLDIFGRASLFELLCTARTQAGEEHLADWLREPSAPDVIRARQEAVAELGPRLDLREDMALLGEQMRGTIHPESLAAWGNQPASAFSSGERALVGVFAAAVILSLLWWGLRGSLLPFLVVFVLEQIYVRTLRGRLNNIIGTVEKPSRDLSVFALLLARIEREPVQSVCLTALRASLNAKTTNANTKGEVSSDTSPSARIARLERLVELLEIPGNPLLKLLDYMVQFSTFCAFAIEDWRQRNGPHIGAWIQAVGEFEALCSLSGYACEHPADPFPEIANDELVLEARGLSHPLLPAETAVRNDLTFSGTHRLYVVSGSNMSGKSTLMRALGTNVVLALAGAPVRAHSLRLCPLRIGASIRTQDSLEAGISRFYAEILRLRQIVDMTTDLPPLLFLLDEILHGTNSHDRRVGAEAVIHALIARGAIGLVTTHDLALARIADESALHAANVHLEDQLLEGKMSFDYCLRPGIVTKSNAIELMRAVGLEV
jgi:hypothetical protein